MSAFSVNASSVVASVEIVSRFREVTSTAGEKEGVAEKTLQIETREEEIENSLELMLELIGKNLNNGVENSHRVFCCITERTRPAAWKKFLKISSDYSEALYTSACQVADEPKLFDGKIREDGFRTYKGNQDFWAKVSEDVIVRVLNALAVDFGYVQGMNVLLAPFLYIMSESDSFFCMRALIQDRIPRYVLKNLDGVHDGAKLFSRCLRICDAKLYTHISSKIPDLSIFSLRYILTLFANSKPLSEVLKLWDAIFAVGIHFNIALLCSKLMLQRDALLKEKRGAKILVLLEETPLDSAKMIDGAFCLMQYFPAPLTHELLSHATSKTVTTTPADSPPPSAHSSGHTLVPVPIIQPLEPTTESASSDTGESVAKAVKGDTPYAGVGADVNCSTGKKAVRASSNNSSTHTSRSASPLINTVGKALPIGRNANGLEHVHVVSAGDAVHT